VITKKLVEHEGFCYFQVTEGKGGMAGRDLNEPGGTPFANGSAATP
jgi:hypothetical protein